MLSTYILIIKRLYKMAKANERDLNNQKDLFTPGIDKIQKIRSEYEIISNLKDYSVYYESNEDNNSYTLYHDLPKINSFHFKDYFKYRYKQNSSVLKVKCIHKSGSNNIIEYEPIANNYLELSQFLSQNSSGRDRNPLYNIISKMFTSYFDLYRNKIYLLSINHSKILVNENDVVFCDIGLFYDLYKNNQYTYHEYEFHNFKFPYLDYMENDYFEYETKIHT